MSEVDRLEAKVQELEDELACALWDNLSQGDVLNDVDDIFQFQYGHMFRSDLEAAQYRLVELGRAERVTDYYIREVRRG